jgi:hypothetical protein
MNVGFTNPDRHAIMFYDQNYVIVDTPDFNNQTRLLKPNNGLKYIGIKRKTCRFCGKNEPDVSFNDDPHLFPESIGNKAYLSPYECDICNRVFGEGIENHYGNFFQFYHSLAGIRGKRKIPKFKSRNGITDDNGKFHPNFEAYWESKDSNNPNDRHFVIIQNKEVSSLKEESNDIDFEEIIPGCCPIAVYKTLVKMAISGMPFTELIYFKQTIKWLLDANHVNIFSSNRLIVRYVMIPGFNVTKYPHFVIYKRKPFVWNIPYMLFNLTYGIFSMIIEVPRDNECVKQDINSVPFPPIPFHTSSIGCWNLSDSKLKENSKHSISFHYDKATDITTDVEMRIENNKRIITCPNFTPNNM